MKVRCRGVMDELKPCKCGSRNLKIKLGYTYGGNRDVDTYYVLCLSCGHEGYSYTEEVKTIRQWNRAFDKRTKRANSSIPILLERMREKLRPYAGLPDDFEQPIPGGEIREIANWLITEVDKEIKGRKR